MDAAAAAATDKCLGLGFCFCHLPLDDCSDDAGKVALVVLEGLDRGDGYRGDDAADDVDDARGKPVPLEALPGLKTGVRALRNSV